MKIATWNVNSINARINNVQTWLNQATPDILLLQEIKCQDDSFPSLDFKNLGYQSVCHGQKSYNGVALLSKFPITDVKIGLEGNEHDLQARWLEATIQGLRVISLYLPNGNPRPGEKFDYKLDWMRRMNERAKALLWSQTPIIMGGDYNICPTDDDVYDPINWREDALCHPQSRALFRELLYKGYTEAFDALHPSPRQPAYTYWDYQAGAWQNNNGLRIDHFLLSPQAADLLMSCDIDTVPRSQAKASDHTPLMLELRDL